MKKRNHRGSAMRVVTLGVAAAAIVVPTAQARHADNERSVPAVAGTLRAGPATARPDDRAGPRGPGAPAIRIAAGTPSTGFDWGDAGVGAGSALLVIGLLAAGLAVAVRRTSDGGLPA